MGTGHMQLLQVDKAWLVQLAVGYQCWCACLQGWWCGVGAGVPVPEAGGVALFGWHCDMEHWGICGVGGGARCCVTMLGQLVWAAMMWQAVACLFLFCFGSTFYIATVNITCTTH
jgi:hypothetical protein